jgi:predicted Zn finger-like uncharacterized protein
MDAARGREAMITHCPSCHTHFRVHAEQLAARAGQVRCGRCSRVFDALEHLIEEIVPPSTGRSSHGFDHASADPATIDSVPEPFVAITEEAAGPDQQRASVEIQHVTVPPPEAATEEATYARTESTQPLTAELEAGPTQLPEPEADPRQAPALEPAMSAPSGVDAVEAGRTYSFNFGPAPNAVPAKPPRRWLWFSGALLLLLALLVQAAYQYRSAIVLLFPELKPHAVELCASLGCDLPLPRRIELMSIDASDLQADTNNSSVMVLTATLKNRAVFSQQHPSLELTLTDAQDQPVVRRVLAPPDYLGRAAGTQAGFGANTEVAIKVYIEGSQVKATGYRLYLFYP